MKPQNPTIRVIVSSAIVFSIAIMIVMIQNFKETEKTKVQQLKASAYPISKQLLQE